MATADRTERRVDSIRLPAKTAVTITTANRRAEQRTDRVSADSGGYLGPKASQKGTFCLS